MKVILRSDLEKVGKRGDICEVSSGYARNYLLPRGLALVATDGAQSQAAAMRRSRDLRDAKDREAAQTIAQALVARTINIKAKAGSERRLFGSITAQDIADAIKSQVSIDLDRRKLHLGEPIKTLGTHSVVCRLHSDVEFPINVEVVAG
jgi:large subunit ribosomal protein L9